MVDPTHGVDEVRDLWVRDGRMITAPTDPATRAERTIDARGDVVMAAGVDIHCHIVGSKVNLARSLRPEESQRWHLARDPEVGASRSGAGGSIPTTFATAAKYAGLGYLTAIDAAIAPLGARAAHREMADTPIIDKAFLVLMGNNHFAMDRIRAGERDRLRDYIAWTLRATQALGIKVVNPGGIEAWKQGGTLAQAGLDEAVPYWGVTPRQILVELARAAGDLGLPHPVHVHTLDLGPAGQLGGYPRHDGRA